MVEQQWDSAKMDCTATDAQNDLMEEGAPSEEQLIAVANWWKKWFGKAGHKRLGRILLEYATNPSNNKIVLDSNTGKFEQVVVK